MKKSKYQKLNSTIPWVALAIALYGAFFSTFQWFSGQAEKERELEVVLTFDNIMAPGAVKLPKALSITAKNPPPQRYDVWINQVGLIFPNGDMELAPNPAKGDWKFPCPVSPGQSKSYLFTHQALQSVCKSALDKGYQDTIEIVGFYIDGDDRIHRSNPLQFNIADGLRLARDQIDDEISSGTDN